MRWRGGRRSEGRGGHVHEVVPDRRQRRHCNRDTVIIDSGTVTYRKIISYLYVLQWITLLIDSGTAIYRWAISHIALEVLSHYPENQGIAIFQVIIQGQFIITSHLVIGN